MLAFGAGSLLDQNRMSALGAGTINRRIPDSIIAIRVLVAGIKELAAAGAFFHQLTLTALAGTFNPGGKWLGVLAVRII